MLALRAEVNKEYLVYEDKVEMIHRYQGACREISGIVKSLTEIPPTLEENNQLGILSEIPE